jgi:release factor glutamine methyltransferase
MTTIFEIKRQLIDQLKALGIAEHEARREAELIVEHATGCDTAQQILNAGENLDKTQENLLRKILLQRQERIPLQYCLGHTWFLGLRFEVEPGIFIPRADTEALVIKANQLISELDQKKLTIVEVGIGSGAIAISLLKLHPDRQVVGFDISETACSVSRKNANLNGVSDRLRIECGDWRNLLPDDIDFLISNPPYIPKSQAQSLLPEVGVHEPPEALFGTEDDGLGFYRDFASLLPSHFRQGQGLIAMEVGDGQSGSVSEIFASQKWFDVQVDLDMSGAPRVVTARK